MNAFLYITSGLYQILDFYPHQHLQPVIHLSLKCIIHILNLKFHKFITQRLLEDINVYHFLSVNNNN